MRDGFVIIDSDGHVHEDQEEVRRHMDPRFRTYPTRGGGFVDRSVGGKYGQRSGKPEIQIADMDTEGIDVAVLYTTMLLGAWALRDRAFSVALHRAYNDWLAEYCSYRPDRLKGVAVLPMVEPEEAARELERCVTQLGHVGAMVHTYIYNHQLNDSCYDDVYACAQQYNVPITFHAQGSEIDRFGRFDTFLAEHTLGHTVEQMTATVQVIYGGIPEKFPSLNIAFLEGMVGWIPMLAERMDEEYEHRPFEAPLLTKPPSAYFKSGRIFFGAEPEEWMIPTVCRFLGSDETLVYSSDYPHWDGAFPNSVRGLTERDDLTRENKRKILGDNARRLYPALAQVPVPA
jgi:predicted TIM-barrel fold metal-dependent hydrolase